MKVLFINFKDIEGGAAVAAYRLSKGLEVYHHTENYFIVAKKSSSDANIFPTLHKESETLNEIQVFIEFIVNRLTGKLGLQYQYFPFSTRFILKKTRELMPDIISLHNTHGGYFKTSLIKKLSKIAPITWTLHDMWSFTANAVHTFGDESWKHMRSGKGEKKIYPHIGIDTGKWLLKKKRVIYKKSDIYIVTPSWWLYNLAKQSPVFENKEIHRILHGLDLEVFKPKDKTSCRRALSIPGDAKVLMFSSSDDLEKCRWKGGQLLKNLLTAIDSKVNHKIEILVLGKGQLSDLNHLENLNIHHIGYINSERFLTVLLSAADLFIYPTKADSLGLALVEAIACETPCVTFDVGGCVDVIREDVSGCLVKSFDTETFADKTIRLLNDKKRLNELSISSRKWAETHFSLKNMAGKYYDLFVKIQSQRIENSMNRK